MGVVAAPGLAEAQFPGPTVQFPPFTVSGSQTVRVSAASFHGSDFNAASPGGQGYRCSTLVQLYDETGEVVAASQMMVGPREARSMTVAGAELGLGPDDLMTVHGALGVAPPVCGRTMTGSLEIIDSVTGKVELLIPARGPITE